MRKDFLSWSHHSKRLKMENTQTTMEIASKLVMYWTNTGKENREPWWSDRLMWSPSRTVSGPSLDRNHWSTDHREVGSSLDLAMDHRKLILVVTFH